MDFNFTYVLGNEVIDVEMVVVDVLWNLMAEEWESATVFVRRERVVVIVDCFPRPFSWERNVVVVVVSEGAVGFHGGGFLMMESVGYDGIVRRRRDEILRRGGGPG